MATINQLIECWLILNHEIENINNIQEIMVRGLNECEGLEILSPNIDAEYSACILSALDERKETAKRQKANFEHRIVKQALEQAGKLEIIQ